MIKSVKLSPELTKKLVRRGAALSIKRTVANTMASAGLTFENEGDRAFVDSVANLNGNYRMLIYAIILILVMLITNNPLLTDFFDQLKKRVSFYLRGSRGMEKRGGAGK